MKRSARATWNGGLKDGRGSFTVGSGAIRDQPVTFRTRFEDAPGTNPAWLANCSQAAGLIRTAIPLCR